MLSREKAEDLVAYINNRYKKYGFLAIGLGLDSSKGPVVRVFKTGLLEKVGCRPLCKVALWAIAEHHKVLDTRQNNEPVFMLEIREPVELSHIQDKLQPLRDAFQALPDAIDNLQRVAIKGVQTDRSSSARVTVDDCAMGCTK